MFDTVKKIKFKIAFKAILLAILGATFFLAGCAAWVGLCIMIGMITSLDTSVVASFTVTIGLVISPLVYQYMLKEETD